MALEGVIDRQNILLWYRWATFTCRPPRAELVRPQPILQQHLQNLKSLRDNISSGRDYLWFCSQLKAVRQDCTVQRIQNSFAVDV